MTVSELTGKGFVGLLALIASAMIAFASWVTVSITATPSRTEVAEMIKDLAPYTDDRNMILEAVKESKKNGNLLREVIENNTKAIIRLESTLDNFRK